MTTLTHNFQFGAHEMNRLVDPAYDFFKRIAICPERAYKKPTTPLPSGQCWNPVMAGGCLTGYKQGSCVKYELQQMQLYPAKQLAKIKSDTSPDVDPGVKPKDESPPVGAETNTYPAKSEYVKVKPEYLVIGALAALLLFRK